MKKHLLIVIFTLTIAPLSAQLLKVQNVTAKIEGQRERVIQIEIPDDINDYYQYITLVKQEKLTGLFVVDRKLYPKDIAWYKLENGAVYVAKEINYNGDKKTVFLEELAKSDDYLVLYAYRDQSKIPEVYFMQQRGEGLVRVSREGEPYKSFLSENTEPTLLITPQDFDETKGERYNMINAYTAFEKKNANYLKRKIRFGPMVGLDMINMEVDKGDYATAFNPAFGVFADFPLSYRSFSFRPELYLQFKNITYTYIADEKNKIRGKSKMKETNLNLPLKIRYTHLDTHRNMKPYVEGGLLISLLLDASSGRSSDDVYPGVMLGTGIELDYYKGLPMYIGLQYTYTKSNLIKTHDLMLSVSAAIF